MQIACPPNRVCFSLVAGCLLFIHFTVHASSLVWTNTAGGNWSSAANWNPNQVPAATDDAVITNAGNYTVTLDANATINRLILGGNGGTQSFIQN
jgi:hypothetical protein